MHHAPMSTAEPLDPAAVDEIVAKVPPGEDDFFHRVLVAVPDPRPSRLARGAKATGRGLLALALFLLGVVAGAAAGFGYGTRLVEGEHGIDLLPAYAEWPVLWWALLASVPVALGLAFWQRVRPLCLGYVLALPWQLVFVLVYAYTTFGTWGYAPTP